MDNSGKNEPHTMISVANKGQSTPHIVKPQRWDHQGRPTTTITPLRQHPNSKSVLELVQRFQPVEKTDPNSRLLTVETDSVSFFNKSFPCLPFISTFSTPVQPRYQRLVSEEDVLQCPYAIKNRSPDSGYSDSGESNSENLSEIELVSPTESPKSNLIVKSVPSTQVSNPNYVLRKRKIAHRTLSSHCNCTRCRRKSINSGNSSLTVNEISLNNRKSLHGVPKSSEKNLNINNFSCETSDHKIVCSSPSGLENRHVSALTAMNKSSESRDIQSKLRFPHSPVSSTHSSFSASHSPINSSFSVSHPPISVSHSQLNVSHSPLSASHSPLSVLQSPLSALQSPLSASHSPLSASHSPLTASHSPLTASHSPLSASHSPLSASHSPLSASQSPLSASHSPLSASHSPLSASYSPLSPNSAVNPMRDVIAEHGGQGHQFSSFSDRLDSVSFPPSSRWMSELRWQTDTECLNTLQSKSLMPDRLSIQNLPSPAAVIKEITRRAARVSSSYTRLCFSMDHSSSIDSTRCRTLLGSVASFLKWSEVVTHTGIRDLISRQIEVLRQICCRLISLLFQRNELSSLTSSKECERSVSASKEVERSVSASKEVERSVSASKEVERSASASKDCLSFSSDSISDCEAEMRQLVDALGHAFTKFVDITISVQLEELVFTLESGDSPKITIVSYLRELSSLCVSSEHISALASRCGAVSVILTLCLETEFSTAALRALAAICCVSEAITQLDKCGGVAIITSLLCDANDVTKCESAAVLAQVSSPWLEDIHTGLTGLLPHIHRVVNAITDLMRTSISSKVLVLGSTVLANLTFLVGDEAVAAMLECSTLSILLNAAAQIDPQTLFIKDQIGSVLSCMSSTKKGAEEILREGGIAILVELLHCAPSSVSACSERIQQKAAIALSRLSSTEAVARSIIEHGGAERLIHLCKVDTLRNNSDAVLVACLAAVRKLASLLSPDAICRLDADELIEPRLLDSFLAFSSKRESFV